MRANRNPARGQTLVLFSLTLLVLTLMVLITLSLGMKTKQKMELQTVADAAAYSNAIATARTYNAVSLLNRASVSDYVAMAGIQSLAAWGTLTGAYMGTLGEMAYTYQEPVPGKDCPMTDGMNLSPGDPLYDCQQGWAQCASGCPADCTARTSETRAAAYEFWHARYSLYWHPGAMENVNQNCVGDGQSCTDPTDRAPRRPPGEGNLDRAVADQARAVREAIHNLTFLEMQTYSRLEQALDNQALSKRLLRISQGLSATAATPPDFELRGQLRGDHVSWREASNAASEDPGDLRDHDYALQMATLGSIGKRFPTYMGSPPPLVDVFMREIQTNLNRNHPGHFTFRRRPGAFRGCAYFAKPMDHSRPSSDRAHDLALCDDSQLGWDGAVGAARDVVEMVYTDGCNGSRRVKVAEVLAVIDSEVSDTLSSNGSMHEGSIDWPGDGFVGGCHGDHQYYDIIDSNEHRLGEPVGRRRDVIPGGIGYVFPVSSTTGAGGAEGQPKIPVLLARKFDPSRPDPWDMRLHFGFTPGGANLDIGGARIRGQPADQGAMANGITYYHRRGYWQEPANLLNPFWRATLVPPNVDKVGGAGTDKTEDMLRASGFRESADLYRDMTRMAPPYRGVQ